MRWRRWLLPCVAAATLLLQAVLHTRAIGSTLSMAGGDGSRQQRSQPRRDWESRTLHASGPRATTVDVVLLSEAYTRADHFFADADRATRSYFSARGATFFGVSALINVHAVYLRSAASKIGRGGPADTAFRCYRARDEPLRAILDSNVTLPRARAACREALGCPGCDFLVLLVNEPLYGGMAAEGVTMITNSPTSGAISARHELAHALADLGEEYDGGLRACGQAHHAQQRTRRRATRRCV